MKVLIVSTVVLLLDQASKLAVRFSFEYGRPHRILGDFLRLTYVENPGMAFSIRFGNRTFFTIFAFLASMVILVYIIRTRHERLLLRTSLALIFGGALGNLLDRILYGKVVDFIDVGLHSMRWPIFNVADSAVTVGMVILAWLILFDKSEKGQPEELAT